MNPRSPPRRDQSPSPPGLPRGDELQLQLASGSSPRETPPWKRETITDMVKGSMLLSAPGAKSDVDIDAMIASISPERERGYHGTTGTLASQARHFLLPGH